MDMSTEMLKVGLNKIVNVAIILVYHYAASNVMIKTRNQQCQPLTCNCALKFQVKLGDFDSAGTVPGLGIKEPTDQMIKFASILPLGTPGYRAPEVNIVVVVLWLVDMCINYRYPCILPYQDLMKHCTHLQWTCGHLDVFV